jgi:hypothetical protein
LNFGFAFALIMRDFFAIVLYLLLLLAAADWAT